MRVPAIKFVGERRHFLIKLIKDKKVLHIGCAESPMALSRIKDGSHLHLQMLRVSRELWGIDLDSAALRLLASFGANNLIEGNVYEMEMMNLPTDFDIILAGEILEHLDNLAQFLTQLRAVCSSEALLVLTTPNAYSLKQFLHVLLGYDNIEPSHLVSFGFSTLHRLLSNHGFQIMRWFSALHTQLSRRSEMVKPLFGLTFHVWPQLADDIIVTCRKC